MQFWFHLDLLVLYFEAIHIVIEIAMRIGWKIRTCEKLNRSWKSACWKPVFIWTYISRFIQLSWEIFPTTNNSSTRSIQKMRSKKICTYTCHFLCVPSRFTRAHVTFRAFQEDLHVHMSFFVLLKTNCTAAFYPRSSISS